LKTDGSVKKERRWFTPFSAKHMNTETFYYNVPCWALPALQYDAEYNVSDSEFDIAKSWQKNLTRIIKKKFGKDSMVSFTWTDEEQSGFFCKKPAFGEACLCVTSKIEVRYGKGIHRTQCSSQ